MIQRQELAGRVDSAFPMQKVLPPLPVLLHGSECLDCLMMAVELERWRNVPIDREGLALLASTQRHLTPDGWLWFVANFLRHMTAEDYPANHVEIESLVYFLSPTREAAAGVLEVVKQMSHEQLEVLIDFHLWLASNDFWQDYAGKEIEAAVAFLRDASSDSLGSAPVPPQLPS